ncbi:hypothetical protein GCM10028771_17310 [Nocardioides marmoraquaticus]
MRLLLKRATAALPWTARKVAREATYLMSTPQGAPDTTLGRARPGLRRRAAGYRGSRP